MEETDINRLRKINSKVYDYFNKGSEEIERTLQNIEMNSRLDESFKNYISSIRKKLQKLTFVDGVLDLYISKNIKKIIKVNKIFRELAIKDKLSRDFIERWYEFIEMYYYPYAVEIQKKCIQYKDNNNDEVKEKRAFWIEITKLFIDLHTSLSNINVFDLEIGYRSIFICGDLRKLCKDL